MLAVSVMDRRDEAEDDGTFIHLRASTKRTAIATWRRTSGESRRPRPAIPCIVFCPHLVESFACACGVPCFLVSLWRVLVIRSGLVSPSPADVIRGDLCHGLYHWPFNLRWLILTSSSINMLRRIIDTPSTLSASSGSINYRPQPSRGVGGAIVSVPRPTTSPSEAFRPLNPTDSCDATLFAIGLHPASSRGAAESSSPIVTLQRATIAISCLVSHRVPVCALPFWSPPLPRGM